MQLPSIKQMRLEGSYSDEAESGVHTRNGSSSVREAQYHYEPVRQILRSEAAGEEIRPAELVAGYEFAPNEFAAINPQEIKAAEVETSDTIDLFHFVNGADVDAVYFERSYYVAPDAGLKEFMRCCFRPCAENNALELPESECIGESIY